MKLYHSLKNFDTIENSTAVTVGMFDSIHLGHQKVLKKLIKISSDESLESVVISFSNSPLTYFKRHTSDDFIFSLEDKIQQIENLGINHLFIIPFDDFIATIGARSFIENILLDKLKAKILILGYDNRFGRGREGSVDFVNKYYAEKLYATSVDAVFLENSNEIISSSLAKSYLLKGKVDEIYKLLGRNFYLKGEVKKGKQLGRQIGFPTANIEFPEYLFLPAQGVYATKIHVDGKVFDSVTNLGFRPTVDLNRQLNIETHIFNFNNDIYEKEVCIEFVKMLRPEMKFNSIVELKNQISKDCRNAKKFLA